MSQIEQLRSAADWLRAKYGWTIEVSDESTVYIGGGDRARKPFLPLAVLIFASSKGWAVDKGGEAHA